MLFIGCSFCLFTVSEKLSEILFSIRDGNGAVAHKHIFSKNYNSWRNFAAIYAIFCKSAGSSPVEVAKRSIILWILLSITFFCFYAYELLGLSGISEVLFPWDKNIDPNGNFFLQLLLYMGVIKSIIPGTVEISYLQMMRHVFMMLSPFFVLLCIFYIFNLLIMRSLLLWLSKKRHSAIISAIRIVAMALLSFVIEIICVLMLLFSLYIMSLFSGFGIVQQGKFLSDGHRVKYGIGLNFPTGYVMGGTITSAPLPERIKLDDIKQEGSIIDLFARTYNGRPESDTHMFFNDGRLEDISATCDYPGLLENECVKKARTLFLSLIQDGYSHASRDEIQKDLLSMFFGVFQAAGPYYCASNFNSSIKRLFDQDWKRTLFSVSIIPLYVMMALYLLRLIILIFSPVILAVDAIVVGAARSMFERHVSARFHILKHFGYFSFLPVVISLWLAHRLLTIFC